MRSRLVLALGFLLLAPALACAPRSGKTHFDRWADQTAKRHEEEAAEARAKDWLMAHAGGAKPAATTGTKPGDGPKASSGAPARHGTETPPVGTSTRATRVIRPADKPAEDDDAIY